VASGVPVQVVGKSMFAFPKLLRHLARAGLHGVDLDQESAHPRAQHRRHPSAHFLGLYVRDREAALESVKQATGCDRKAAKELFLRLLYAGGVAGWCGEHGVEEQKLPPFVAAFKEEQERLRSVDAAREASLLEAARAAGHERPDVMVQVVLNSGAERASLDAMAAAVDAVPLDGRVASFEHDGLYVSCPSQAAVTRVTARVQASCDVPVQVKPIPSCETALDELMRRFPGEWDGVDADWSTQLDAIRAARRPAAKGRADRQYALIVATEAVAYPGRPWRVKDVFKHSERGQYAFYDREANAWVAAGDLGRNVLLDVIGDVLQRRLGNFLEAQEQDPGQGAMHILRRGESDPTYDYAPLLERVEKLLRAPLTDPGFELDGEGTRRYLRFTNGVYDRVTDSFGPNGPELRTTGCVNWAWTGSGLGEDVERRLDDALTAWQAAEQNNCQSALSAAGALLDDLAESVPDLRFVHSLLGTWPRTVYCLKHMSRATFALPYTEWLCTRGPGGNGKDTLANRMAEFLSGYSVTLACEALTQARSLDAPSQTLLSLRAKRWVSVRELSGSDRLRGHIIKTLSDAKARVKARGLWGRDCVFSPHWLLYLCTNSPQEFDEGSNLGLGRRLRLLDMPFRFTATPSAANERQLIADLEEKFPTWNASLFHLLRAVLKTFLSSAANGVTPIPEEVAENGANELHEEWMTKLAAFVEARVRPTDDGARAATAADVRQAYLAATPGLDKKSVGLRLASGGFAESVAHYRDGVVSTSKRTYSYAFGGVTRYVALKPSP
jgi:phage/plasmid-associated DNA primase